MSRSWLKFRDVARTHVARASRHMQAVRSGLALNEEAVQRQLTPDAGTELAHVIKQESKAVAYKREAAGQQQQLFSNGLDPPPASWSAEVSAALDSALCQELMLPVHWAMQAQKRRCQGALRDHAAGADPSQAAGAGAVAVRSSAGTAEQGAGRDAGLARDGLPRDAVEVRLLVPRVLCASIGLAAQGQPRPLRVVMDAADKAIEVDSWACPSHQVFRRLSALATKALTYFVRRADVCCLLQPDQPALAPGQPEALPPAAGAGTASAGAVALEDLLLWLSSYQQPAAPATAVQALHALTAAAAAAGGGCVAGQGIPHAHCPGGGAGVAGASLPQQPGAGGVGGHDTELRPMPWFMTARYMTAEAH
ncbi:uncharacterized protein HaLaN_19148 [Haematococcus lacustris]|uniref:Uncharacterized protein n=1 Tax=Haematococcus lacustris TaxID=44745 RepID=A0A699ZZT8_HAELA|nr:uncharacterized protein HaLaN_19148 [Haematococcus lacustris]